MSISEIHALLALMDDPDETVYHHVRDRLLSKGKEVLPYVTSAAASGPECSLFQSRINRLQEGLMQSDIREELALWMEEGGRDLWSGILLVQRAVYPEWSIADSNFAFEALKKEVWLELNEELTALEQVRILNHIFFSAHQMEGVRRLPHQAAEAIPSGVLHSKKGNPLGLGMLYLAIAESLDIPMRGINLPSHFILAYCDRAHLGDDVNQKGQAGILFYVNPFSQGTIIGPDEVTEFLSHMENEESGRQWRPAQTMELIQRLVGNVAFAFREEGDEERSSQLLDVFSPLLSAFENAEKRSDDYPNV